MLVTLAFLRSVRSTPIVAVAIPTSIVATFYFFDVRGSTLNILTLMALQTWAG